jgi:D-arabinose 1-dehydrogenase-like Zn-dependent alcohol dehydrogenase
MGVLGAPQFKPFDIIDDEKSIVGSKIGGIAAMKEMLEFSAAHKCFPQVEIIPLDAANEGFKRIESNAARYRVVLKVEGFREGKEAAAGK